MTLLGAVPLLSEPTYCFFFSSRVNGSMSQKVLCPKTTPQPISDPRPNLNHDMAYFNPRAYMQIHTSTVVQGGGRLDDPPPPSPLQFFIYCSILKRFYFDILYKIRYILRVVLQGACDITKNGRHLGRHLRVYQN